MLRALLLLLLLANALFFAWTRGWLAPAMQPPRHAEREPERITAQVRPEKVQVLPPAAAGSAVAAARALSRQCLEAGPLADAKQLDAAEAALVQAGVPPGSWARGAPQAGQAAGVWLRMTQMDAEMLARVRGLQDPALDGGFRPCEAPR
jgi:hypothetical protein